ncbi:ABC transporter ATP-binding protein [Clostridium nigeriense]|uniref:ABC transporter ATP-binding protein n=1 Tax=Clostridium nigeriense TaxID=1805470 RepID=UPI003D34BF06
MSLLKIENLDIEFDNRVNKKQKVKVLSDINLEVEEGEIVAVVGESGCGKTTLGKLIVGIHKQTKGKILYKGKEISKLKKAEFKEYRLGVQMVHQDSFAALNPNRTIFQSLSMPLLQHKIAKNKQEAEEILKEYFAEVGLVPQEQFLYKYPHQLSGGQRQRILLARALSVKPKLIVADEPVSMVDVSLRISLIDLMTKMNKKYNISFVYITHDLATARYIAKNGRLVVMYLGRIIELNNIYDAIDNPKHPYFHALLAAVPQSVGKRADGGSKELPLRTLDMPSIINPPSGCKFHTRCPYYTEKCEKEEPNLVEYKGGYVACHHVERIGQEVLKRKVI